MVEHREMLENGECKDVLIRTRTYEDMDMVFDFYKKLPDDVQELAPIDVLDRSAVERRFEDVQKGGGERLVAICNDTGEMIAEAILENMRLEWMRKTGELRFLVLTQHRSAAIARALSQEIFLLAARRGLNHLIVKMMDKDAEMRAIFEEMNFMHEATQRGHAYDKAGNPHDIYVMSFSLRKMWNSLEEMVRSTDAFSREH